MFVNQRIFPVEYNCAWLKHFRARYGTVGMGTMGRAMLPFSWRIKYQNRKNAKKTVDISE